MLWPRKHKLPVADPTPLEEMQAIIDRAAKFDRLVSEPGWDIALEHITAEVNASITSAATTDNLRPEAQTIHVIRWNAKRELMDSVLNYIADTRRQRDEILRERRDMEAQDVWSADYQ